MKTPEQAAFDVIGASAMAGIGYDDYYQWVLRGIKQDRAERASLNDEEIAQAVLDAHSIRPDWRRTGEQIIPLIVEALSLARAEPQDSAIFIVQDEGGDVVNVFRDPEEADARYQTGSYTIIEETVWEPGQFAQAEKELDA